MPYNSNNIDLKVDMECVVSVENTLRECAVKFTKTLRKGLEKHRK